MMAEDELAVAAGLAADPGATLEYAWTTLQPTDFEDDACRWLFGLLVETWHRSGGDFEPGPRYRPLLAHWYAAEFDVPAAIGFVWLEELEAAALPDVAFRFHAERLATRGALRRIREALATWYQAVTTLCVSGAPIPHFAAYPQAGELQNATRFAHRTQEGGTSVVGGDPPLQDVRGILAGLLKDVRAAVRRCPVAPENGRNGEKELDIGW